MEKAENKAWPVLHAGFILVALVLVSIRGTTQLIERIYLNLALTPLRPPLTLSRLPT
jgi:hypothetical protein